MAKSPVRKKREQPVSNEVQAAQIFQKITTIREISRTIRALAVCGVVTFFLYVVWDIAIALVNVPWYVTLISALLPAIPGIVLCVLEVMKFRRVVQTTVKQSKEIQETVDQHRTSSGINEDGTEPEE